MFKKKDTYNIKEESKKFENMNIENMSSKEKYEFGMHLYNINAYQIKKENNLLIIILPVAVFQICCGAKNSDVFFRAIVMSIGMSVLCYASYNLGKNAVDKKQNEIRKNKINEIRRNEMKKELYPKNTQERE